MKRAFASAPSAQNFSSFPAAAWSELNARSYGQQQGCGSGVQGLQQASKWSRQGYLGGCVPGHGKACAQGSRVAVEPRYRQPSLGQPTQGTVGYYDESVRPASLPCLQFRSKPGCQAFVGATDQGTRPQLRAAAVKQGRGTKQS